MFSADGIMIFPVENEQNKFFGDVVNVIHLLCNVHYNCAEKQADRQGK